MYTITAVHVDGRKTVLRNYNREWIFKDVEKLENVVYYKLSYRPIGRDQGYCEKFQRGMTGNGQTEV